MKLTIELVEVEKIELLEMRSEFNAALDGELHKFLTKEYNQDAPEEITNIKRGIDWVDLTMNGYRIIASPRKGNGGVMMHFHNLNEPLVAYPGDYIVKVTYKSEKRGHNNQKIFATSKDLFGKFFTNLLSESLSCNEMKDTEDNVYPRKLLF